MAALLYLGASNSGYWVNPHAVDVANEALSWTPDGPLVYNKKYTIKTIVQNHGDIAINDAVLRLYWADPATSYLPNRCTRIKETAAIHVDAFSDQVGQGWPTEVLCTWIPSACTLESNGGSVALLAQVFSVAAGQYPSGLTTTDARSAVHNIQIVPAELSAKLASVETARTLSIAPTEVHFAFAATNPTKRTVRTEVVAIDLATQEKRSYLEHTLRSTNVRGMLSGAQPEAQVPLAFQLRLGIERVVASCFETGQAGVDEVVFRSSRMGHSGLLTVDALGCVLADSKEETATDFELRPYESRQMILGVVPHGSPGDIHPIELIHRTVDTQEELGRLMVIFVVGRGFEG